MLLRDRTIILRALHSRIGFKFDYHSEEVSSYIVVQGKAEQASFISRKNFILICNECSENYNYEKVKALSIDNEEKEILSYGRVILLKPDGETFKEEQIEVYMQLKSSVFAKLKDLIEKSVLSGKSTLIASLSIIGMKLGFEPELDQFPIEQPLPVVAFDFFIQPNEG